MGKEKLFENRVKRLLESYKIYPLGGRYKNDIQGVYEKRWGGGYFTKAGLPDLHVTYLGVTIEIELKAENGTTSPLQMRTMEQLNKAKIISMVLRPSQINELVGLLDAMSKTKDNKDEKENCDNE